MCIIMGCCRLHLHLTYATHFMPQATRRSMTLVGIPKPEQDAAFRTVAAVLHLGNLDFVEGGDSDSSTIAPDARKHLAAAAKLLGVDAAGLLKALTTRTRQTVDGAPKARCACKYWSLLLDVVVTCVCAQARQGIACQTRAHRTLLLSAMIACQIHGNTHGLASNSGPPG